VQAPASYLGYMDVFWVLMLISLLAVPLALTVRKSKLGAAAPAGLWKGVRCARYRAGLRATKVSGALFRQDPLRSHRPDHAEGDRPLRVRGSHKKEGWL
jgi:hypothetical protein